MSRLKPCLKCTPEDGKGSKFSIKRGFTRHKDQICSRCRTWGPPVRHSWKGRAG